MSCFAPLTGYRSRSVNASGKRSIVFSVREGFVDLPVSVPCGQCDGCRLERSRQWAVRCLHEASLYERNCFITLTYADVHLPSDGSLDKSAFQKFMKRLRKRFPAERIRYYHCGEYGELYGRPHYHACLFNFDFPDKALWTMRKGLPAWRSAVLEELWPFGNSEIGSVTFESAAYVARYIMKKVLGDSADAHYRRLCLETGELMPVEPEYTTMSRRPGIGQPWLEKYMADVYPADSVLVRGKLCKPPRYYDGKYEVVDAAGARRVALKRERRRNPEEETWERLEVREKVLRASLEANERGLPC